ncbi:MAG TPA: peptidase [Lachnospiraceae bacterium]|jgi:regulator of protease activity HflC (stomatin/prohibitin superfamily)|nr:peptidase [Lachnospiraceae bacterium]
MTGLILFLIIVVLIIWLLAVNIRVVPQAQAYVVEHLGRFKCIWGAGLHLKAPFVEKIVRRVSLKEQVLDFPPQPVITKDNIVLQLDSVVYCRVFDPRLYTYGVEDAMAGLQNLTATTLRNIAGEMELDQLLTSRDQINQKLETILDQATDAWGIKVTRVELKNIQPPKEIAEVMTKQMRAERERRQTVLEAQAHQEAVVSRAEGDKKAKILAAEAERDAQIALAQGRAKSIELVYQAEADGLKALKDADIDEHVLKLKGIEALKDVADGRATKIYMPSDIASVVSSLGVAGEALGIGDATSIDKTPKPQPQPAADPCITDETSQGGKEAAEANAQIEEHLDQMQEEL